MLPEKRRRAIRSAGEHNGPSSRAQSAIARPCLARVARVADA